MKLLKCCICGETINDKMNVCPFCGNDIEITEETEVVEEINSDDPEAKPWEKNNFFTDEENMNSGKKINPAYRFYLDEEDENAYFERDERNILPFRDENPLTNVRYIVFSLPVKIWLWLLIAVTFVAAFGPLTFSLVQKTAVSPLSIVSVFILLDLFFLMFNGARVFFILYLILGTVGIAVRVAFGNDPLIAVLALADIIITFFLLYRYYRRDREQIEKEAAEEALARREKIILNKKR